MPFTFKLARRLARLKDAVVQVAVTVPPVPARGFALARHSAAQSTRDLPAHRLTLRRGTLLVLMATVACEQRTLITDPPNPAPVAAVAVSPATTSLLVGGSEQLTATPLDSSGTPLLGRVVTWASSNTDLAGVSGNGLVAGLAAGSVTITATSEARSGTASIVIIAPGSQGDQSVLPAGPPPALSQAGASALDPVFGRRLIRLTDAALCPSSANHAYSYWAALNVDNTRLLANCASVPTIFQVDLANGTVVSLGAAFQAVQMWWEGTIWSRSAATLAYGIYGSTSNARLLVYDFGNHTYTVLKDLKLDSRFTGVWGTSNYLWQLSADTAQTRFAATVRQSGGTEVGGVVWDRSTDQVWNYRLPSGEALDEVQIDRTGRYLVIKLLGRKWQVWRLSDPSPSAVMLSGPGHSDNGAGLLFQGHGRGLNMRTLDPPSGQIGIYSSALVDGKSNPYADAHTSVLASGGWVHFTTYTDDVGGAVHVPWVQHSGAIYKLDWNQEMTAWPTKRPPDVVRMGRTALTRVTQIPTAPGQWYLDASNFLYVWNPGGEPPGSVKMIVFDWRPIHEEIVRVRQDGSVIERLAHHYSHVEDYGSMPRAAASYDGRYVVFNSNWAGGSRIDVYAVQVQP